MKKALPFIYPILFLVVFGAIVAFNSVSIFGYKFHQTSAAGDSIASSTPIIDQFSLEEIKKIFPEAASYKVITEDKASIFDSNNQQIGEALHTLPDCKDLKGFAGNIPIIIGIDLNDRITGIVTQSNQETPPFFKRVKESGILDKWKKQLASEAANLKVDAVTGATLSSSCIINSVKTRVTNHILRNNTYANRIWSKCRHIPVRTILGIYV